MNIACLGWGSLVWDPCKFVTRGGWLCDGPSVPVEFKRKSADGCITLVIDSDAVRVQVLWSLMPCDDLEQAIDALRNREGLTSKSWRRHIGIWQPSTDEPQTIPGLKSWAKDRGLDAVIWTALPAKLDNLSSPSSIQVVQYLKALSGPERQRAERYVRCAPRQIDTQYRREIEAVLGWLPKGCEFL